VLKRFILNIEFDCNANLCYDSGIVKIYPLEADCMVNIKGISKSFKKNPALIDVSFDIADGEIVGLLGENGAGKSTLLRTIGTMLVPDCGTAVINGFDLVKNAQDVRRNIGVLFGNEVGLYERLTARENLEYFAKLNGMSDSTVKERIDFLIKQFEFTEYADKLVGKLSKGMRQKTAVARSIVHDPAVILFDEPDSGLDFRAARIVFDFLGFCKNTCKSVIFSSHSMENIKAFSDRIVVIHKGRIRKIFDVKHYMQLYTDRQINEILYNIVCDD
jgi:sodium transport system ATP-binding protein